MNPLRQYCVLIFLSISFLFLSCKENGTESLNQFRFGELFNITVQGIQYDEFERILPFQGPASVQLITSEKSFSGIINATDSFVTFNKVPSQNFILRGEKTGFYPHERIYYRSPDSPPTLHFYPLPSPESKVDSIYISSTSTDGKWLTFKVVGHQQVPKDGMMRVTMFFGLDSTVSSKEGTYFGTHGWMGSNVNTFKISFYKDNYHFNPGTTIYATARILTPATKSYYDDATGLTVFINVEENTKIFTSFSF